MAYNSTTWTDDTLTAATALTTTNEAVSVGGTFSVSGASTLSNTLTVGEDDTGYDVKFFGATSGAYMLWDESTDDLKIVGGAGFIQSGAGANVFTGSSAFGTNSYLTITDNEIDVSSGNLTLDVAGDVTINSDGGDFIILDDSTLLGKISLAYTSIMFGTNSGAGIASDLRSVAIGHQALSAEDGASGNVAIGYQAMEDSNNDNADKNVAIGYLAMNACTAPGDYNVAIGSTVLDLSLIHI